MIIFLIFILVGNIWSLPSDLMGVINANLSSEDISISSLSVDTVYYNPANLSFLEYNSLKFSHISYLSDISQESLAFGLILNESSSFGIFLNYLHLSDIKFDRDNYKSLKNEGYFNGRLSYGLNLGDGFLIGSGIKYGFDMSETKYRFNSFLGLDFGITFDQILFPYNTLEFYFENLLTNSKDSTFSFYSGMLNMIDEGIFLSLGFHYFINLPNIFSVGFQFEPISNLIKIKTGFKYNNKRENFINFIFLGFGISLENFNLEYSFIPIFSFEGIFHKISLEILF